jgi:hypothetical protein
MKGQTSSEPFVLYFGFVPYEEFAAADTGGNGDSHS